MAATRGSLRIDVLRVLNDGRLRRELNINGAG
jgi:hypothetical protein